MSLADRLVAEARSAADSCQVCGDRGPSVRLTGEGYTVCGNPECGKTVARWSNSWWYDPHDDADAYD